MADHPPVMVSSTTFDLPNHREQVKNACLRQGMFPIMMEHLPASDAEAIQVSKSLVDNAEVYIGIFAHRYGHVPKGYDISLTEIEYNRAFDRGIPRLIFLMHDDHPIKFKDVEKGEGEVKLEAFTKRLTTQQVVNFFKSPEELLAQVINSLAQYRQGKLVTSHYSIDIPQRPDAYIAHPDSIIQSQEFIGRQDEINQLTNWVSQSDRRIFNLIGFRGMGKSTLAWKWFKDIAPYDMPGVVGSVWWSFHKKDRFEDFIRCTLAYTSGEALESIRELQLPLCKEKLLDILDSQPYLLVLDSFEQVLTAYAHNEASGMADSTTEQEVAKNAVREHRMPDSAAHSFSGQHRLRKVNDPLVGDFLRALAKVQAARILITTRLYPLDLQDETGKEMPGCKVHFLTGLNDVDTVNLWRAFKLEGSRDELLRLFHTFDNYPMLIHGFATQIARYRRLPDNLQGWRQDFE